MRRLMLIGPWIMACAVTPAATGGTESAVPRVAAATTPASPGPCSMRNEGFHGVTEVAYTYEEGRRIRAVESGPSGERQTLWSYDPSGQRTKEVVIDGATITTRTFQYDRRLLVREDVHDSAQDRVTIQRHRRYDDAGVLTERSEAHWSDGSWVIVDHHALHYNDEGRFVYELRTRTPPTGARSFHSTTVEVDSRGRVIARRTDEGMDGTFDQVALFDFDDEGRLITVTQMEGETIDNVARHTYDTQGRLTQTTVEDGQGQPQGRSTYDFSCWD